MTLLSCRTLNLIIRNQTKSMTKLSTALIITLPTKRFGWSGVGYVVYKGMFFLELERSV